jgi:hypothetical protein
MTAFLIFIESREPAILSFFVFLSGFAVDAHRRNRSGLEARDPDLFSAIVANPVSAVVEPSERLFDFDHELALALPDPQDRVALGFHRGPVSGIREVIVAARHSSLPRRIRLQIVHALLKKPPEELNVLLLHDGAQANFYNINKRLTSTGPKVG